MSLRRENRDHGEQGEMASSAAKAECFGQLRTEIRTGMVMTHWWARL